jgi:SAM-dependent methyltransferase
MAESFFSSIGRPTDDRRLDAPAFHRNRAAIWSVLAPFLHGGTGDVLEVGSGTGQHVVAFAGETPDIVWWPSDIDPIHLESIAAWRLHAGLDNVRPPLRIDVSDASWPLRQHGAEITRDFLAILCANVLHIAPWRVSEGLLGGVARHLRPDGRLFVYGPVMRNGRHTATSNAEFDAYLRQQDPEWGVRDVADLAALAERGGLTLIEIVDMPANNVILTFAPEGRHSPGGD